ncbi:MAG: conserved phage C-terminal domain-containing protein [Bacteroidales bacterium]|nr:conserved phage C-terminal domain-containing protein [Candidatus Latescibacterota bacterium]
MRTIRPGFFENEDLAELEPTTRLIFCGLWCMADREGILEDRPKKIKMALLPLDDFDPDKALDDLERIGMVTRYRDGHGQRLLFVVNFEKHQNCHPNEAESKFEKPNALDPGKTEEHQGTPIGEPRYSQENPKVGSCKPLTSLPSLSSLSSKPSLPTREDQEVSSSEQLDGQIVPAKIQIPTKANDPIPYAEIIGYLNFKAGTRFRPTTKPTRQLIKARWKDGYRLEDFRTVIDSRVKAWGTDPKMGEFLRPNTLFKPDNFDNYLNGRQPIGGPRLSDVSATNQAALEAFLLKGKEKEVEFHEVEAQEVGPTND